MLLFLRIVLNGLGSIVFFIYGIGEKVEGVYWRSRHLDSKWSNPLGNVCGKERVQGQFNSVDDGH